jgi:hypothetical protein
MILLQNKLIGNADLYPTDKLKIIYVSRRVGGNALALIAPHLVATSQYKYYTIDNFYNYITELYRDPNKETNACKAFKKLTMEKT